MREVRGEGNIPKPLLALGIFNEESLNKLSAVMKKLQALGMSDEDIDYLNTTTTSEFKVYECSNLTELAQVAELDDCMKQVVTDKDTGRHYLCALTIDPGRVKTHLLESGIYTIDTRPRPARVLYFLEISNGEFKLWRRSDIEQRRDWWNNKLRVEKEKLDGRD